MAAASASGSILLEPASLYVSTTQLSESKFHWSLVATDATGCLATRHHWHERPGNFAEGYGFQRIQPKSLSGRVVLGYFKVRGYTQTDLATFAAICRNVFESSYATVPENRKNGMCRRSLPGRCS